MILDLFEHMYQVGFHQELQVLCQVISQNQVQLLIQVELVAIKPQNFHTYLHQWNIMMILYLNHHMYQVIVHP